MPYIDLQIRLSYISTKTILSAVSALPVTVLFVGTGSKSSTPVLFLTHNMILAVPTIPDINFISILILSESIPYNVDREIEIIKQLYDIPILTSYIDDFSEVKSNYYDIVKTELKYRSIAVKLNMLYVTHYRPPYVV